MINRELISTNTWSDMLGQEMGQSESRAQLKPTIADTYLTNE